MRAWTLAAIASFAVCCFGCGFFGFWVNGMTGVGVVIAVVFMGASSLAVAFHAMRGMYLHAERLLAKAGRQGAREGYLPLLERKQSWSGKIEAKRRSAQAQRGRLRETLAPRQGGALSEVWFPHSCA